MALIAIWPGHVHTFISKILSIETTVGLFPLSNALDTITNHSLLDSGLLDFETLVLWVKRGMSLLPTLQSVNFTKMEESCCSEGMVSACKCIRSPCIEKHLLFYRNFQCCKNVGSNITHSLKVSLQDSTLNLQIHAITNFIFCDLKSINVQLLHQKLLHNHNNIFGLFY
jgi:hypothetical protein